MRRGATWALRHSWQQEVQQVFVGPFEHLILAARPSLPDTGTAERSIGSLESTDRALGLRQKKEQRDSCSGGAIRCHERVGCIELHGNQLAIKESQHLTRTRYSEAELATACLPRSVEPHELGL